MNKRIWSILVLIVITACSVNPPAGEVTGTPTISLPSPVVNVTSAPDAAAAAGAFLYLVPPIGVLAGAVMLGEPVTQGMVIGGLLILAGVAIAQFGSYLTASSRLAALAARIVVRMDQAVVEFLGACRQRAMRHAAALAAGVVVGVDQAVIMVVVHGVSPWGWHKLSKGKNRIPGIRAE